MEDETWLAKYEWKQTSIDVHLDPSAFDPIPRTWKERYLSWPWRPWVKTKPSMATLIQQHIEANKAQLEEMCGISPYMEGE